MFRAQSKLILAIPLLIAMVSCQRAPSKWEPGEPFLTQVVVESSQGAKLQVVELQGVRDSKTLRGDLVEFTLAPGEKTGPDGKRLVGQAPVARFMENKSGVFIPADVLTLQMTTLYFHLQSLKTFEKQLQLDEGLSWPRQVGLRAKTRSSENRFNNAFYNAELDVLYFVPYSEEHLPVPLNAGVVGHEIFHAYFAKKVTQALKVSELSTYQEYALKSLNEGLADVWGWLFSGNPDFVALSLPRTQTSRTLEAPKDFVIQLPTESQMRREASAAEQICPQTKDCKKPNQLNITESYENGTQLARLMKALAYVQREEKQESFEEMRVRVAKSILKLLPQIAEMIKSDELSIEKTMIEWAKQNEIKSKRECDLLKDTMIDSRLKDQVCSSK